jgi:hypothetical protein
MRYATRVWLISGAVFVFAIFGMFLLGFCVGKSEIHKVELELNAIKEQEKVEVERTQILSDLIAATSRFNFLENMPAEQALYWTTLVQMARRMPDSPITKEWGLRFMPIGITITDRETGNVCDIVVGTIDTNEMEDKALPRRFTVKPHMTCYLTVPTGQIYRFESLTNMSSSRYRPGVGEDYQNFTSDQEAAVHAKMITELLRKNIIGK